jgi:hypothetical protein
VTIRDATEHDLELLRRLRDEFQQELDKPPFFDEPWETVAEDVEDTIANGDALIAEDDGARSATHWHRLCRRRRSAVTSTTCT